MPLARVFPPSVNHSSAGVTLGLHNISKIYCHRKINMRNKHDADNCLNCNRLHSMYHLFVLCATIRAKKLGKSDSECPVFK